MVYSSVLPLVLSLALLVWMWVEWLALKTAAYLVYLKVLLLEFGKAALWAYTTVD